MGNLEKIGVAGELTLETPSGSRILLQGGAAAAFNVRAEDYDAVRELLQLSQSIYPSKSLFGWLRTPNPTGQDLIISVGPKEVISWPAGKRMRIVSFSGSLKLLFGG